MKGMSDGRTRGLGLFLGVSALVISGCGGGTQAPPQAAPPSAPPPVAAGVKPAVSINAVMVAMVDHAGHVLWDAEREGRAPKTDAEWAEIEHHAIQVTAAGPLVSLGGTGPMDATWVQSPEWQTYSQQMIEVGVALLAAARSKNQQALVAVNGQLVESCEACHKQFKPDLPTEGLVHSHIE